MTRSIKVVTQRLRTAGCPLATVVNVLIGAPVMPLVVKVVNASRGWHEAGSRKHGMNCLMTAWHEHETELRGWLRHRLGNAFDAEDLLQDVFLKATRQGERFCAIISARGWLYEVARNAVADRLRLARDTVELPNELSAAAEETAAVDSLAACLPRVLSELSPEDREAITLCDLERLPHRAMGSINGARPACP